LSQKSTRSIAEGLARMLLQLKRFGINRDKTQGVRQSEFIMLSALVHSDEFQEKGAKTKDLGEILNITPAGVTHIITALEDKNLVRRYGDATDKRVVRVRPTANGKKLVDSVVVQLIKRCEGLAGKLGAKDARELIRLLGLTFDYLNKND
jgi:DNA-binding MarR family transcriptional regulator